MGTANLGRHTSRGAGILMMGVSGGAVFPPIQGAIADAHSTRISFLVPMVGFIVVFAYAVYHWVQHGLKIKRLASTVDIHVVPTPGQKRASIILSQETIDTLIESHRRLSLASQSTNPIKSKSVAKMPETHTTGNINQTFITTENL